MISSHSFKRHVLLLGLVVIVAGFIAASDALFERSEDIIAAAESFISRFPLLGMLVFVLLAMMSAMWAFFSSAVLVPIGVQAWGAVACCVLLWIGWLLGGIACFGIGRYLGRSVASRLAGEARISQLEGQLSRHARFVHILLFQLSVPSEIPGYILGILHYRFGLFLAALAIAELPYAIGTVYLGASFLQRNSLVLVLAGVVGIILSALAYRYYRKLGR